MRIAVVGGGWSGLAAGTFLQEEGHEVDLFEAAPEVGGRIGTLEEGGYLVERGPHGVIPSQEPTRRLLELAGEPLVHAPRGAPRFVLQGGRPRSLPGGPLGLLTTPLLSPRAKLRLLREPFQGPGPPGETVADLARRRLGRGTLPLMDAVVTGVFAGDPERLVVERAFPELFAMDRAGGIFRALARSRKRRPPLTAPADGMEALVRALARRLRVRTRAKVERLVTSSDGVEVHVDGAPSRYDRAVVALDPHDALRLLRVQAEPPPLAQVHVVAFGAEEHQVDARGYGILAPESEGAFVLGALFESSLFPGRAPAGHALVRCLVGGRRHPERADLDPSWIAARAWEDLATWGFVRGEPARTFHLRTRGIPQPEAGQDAWSAALPREGVHVLGIGLQAVGLDKLAAEASALSRTITQ